MTTENESVIIWNSKKNRYDWTVTLPDGQEITGYADTEDQARRDMRNDWRVRGDKPRFVGPRSPRFLIQPPAEGET